MMSGLQSPECRFHKWIPHQVRNECSSKQKRRILSVSSAMTLCRGAKVKETILGRILPDRPGFTCLETYPDVIAVQFRENFVA